MSSSKRNSTKKVSHTGRASQLLDQGPIASLLHSYIESTENALIKLVKNAEPNGILSRREILERERILQSLANTTKKFKNSFTRRQQLIIAARKRYHKYKANMEQALTENNYYKARIRLDNEKVILRRLGINIE